MAESGVDALSEGLQRVIAPAVRECDAAASSCATAQADLTAHVDRLAHELEVLLAAMPAEASEGHAERVRRVRARVEALGIRMADVEGRMTRLHRAAAGLRRADIAKLLFRNGDDLELDDDDAELPPREELYHAGAVDDAGDEHGDEPEAKDDDVALASVGRRTTT